MMSYLGEAEVRVPQLQALVGGVVEVRLRLPVGDEGAAHPQRGHLQLLLLHHHDTTEEEQRNKGSVKPDENRPTMQRSS